jgi:hypothetical protein
MYPRRFIGLGDAVPDVAGPVSGRTQYTPEDYSMMWGGMQSGGYVPPGGDRLWAEAQAWHATMADAETRSNIVLQKGYMVGQPSSLDPSGWVVHPDTQTVITMLMTVPIATLQALPVVSEVAKVYDPLAHQYDATPAPTGPPAGWHESPPTSENPAGGWYGPDGLFYTGTAPWNDPHAVGRSVVSPPPPVAPPPPSAEPPVAKTTAPEQGTTQPIQQSPSQPPPTTGGAVPYDYFPVGPAPFNAGTEPLSTPHDAAPVGPGGEPPLLAGMSGGTLLLIGGGILGALLLSRRKGR